MSIEQSAESIEPSAKNTADKSAKKEKKTDFESETQQNLMKIVMYLATDVLRPTTMKEIQDALGLTYNKTLWSLQNLKLAGWAEQIADGWRLGPRLPRIAEDVRKGITDTVKRYIGE
jgi:predicted Rossmann fold nucleotide-binding protein DprA/Smf involved in DNA uptake